MSMNRDFGTTVLRIPPPRFSELRLIHLPQRLGLAGALGQRNGDIGRDPRGERLSEQRVERRRVRLGARVGDVQRRAQIGEKPAALVGVLPFGRSLGPLNWVLSVKRNSSSVSFRTVRIQIETRNLSSHPPYRTFYCHALEQCLWFVFF
jgi:hypothetical protein